jgi:hypothetical protein
MRRVADSYLRARLTRARIGNRAASLEAAILTLRRTRAAA